MNTLYNVNFYHIDYKSGIRTGGYQHGRKMNHSPMTHTEACIFQSKMPKRKNASFAVEPVGNQ